MSVVGTILVLVVLGLMGAIVVKAMPSGNGGSRQVVNQLLEEIEEQDEPPAGSTTTAVAPAPLADDKNDAGMSGGMARGPRGGVAGDVDQSACEITANTLTTAVQAYVAQTGAPPQSWAELVAVGHLREEPAASGYVFTLERINGMPSGKLLVNGTEGASGCSGPAATGE